MKVSSPLTSTSRSQQTSIINPNNKQTPKKPTSKSSLFFLFFFSFSFFGGENYQKVRKKGKDFNNPTETEIETSGGANDDIF
jgi:hypothetical protein